MNSFFENTKTLDWWLGVIFVGIILNLLSAFLFRHLDRGLANFSSKRRSARADKELLREKRISRLQEAPEAHLMHLGTANWHLTQSNHTGYLGLLSFVFVILAKSVEAAFAEFLIPILLILGFILIFFSKGEENRARSIYEELLEARIRINSARIPTSSPQKPLASTPSPDTDISDSDSQGS